MVLPERVVGFGFGAGFGAGFGFGAPQCLYRRSALLGLDGPAMPHQRNPAYCGVCGKWVVGLSQHQTRSMTHLKLYAPIRKRLAEQRAAQRGQ